MFELIESIEDFLEILRMDSNSSWVKHFEDILHEAKKIEQSGGDEVAIRDLCATIRAMFSAKSPFAEYVPAIHNPKTGRYQLIPGTEKYQDISKRISDLSEEIRTVGSH